MSDINTKEIDFARAQQLLSVVHDCAGVGPKLTSLSNAAMTELTKMNDAVKVAAIEAEKERVRQEGLDRAAAMQANQDAAEEENVRSEEIKRRSARSLPPQNPALDPTGDPAKPDPDEDLLGRVHPTVHPSDSRTATIADNNIPIVERRV